VSKPTRKRRPEILKPGLKALTPAERKRVEEIVAADRRRWQVLFGMNAWASTPAEVAKHSRKVKGGRP
jgi:hypothetical protein